MALHCPRFAGGGVKFANCKRNVRKPTTQHRERWREGEEGRERERERERDLFTVAVARFTKRGIKSMPEEERTTCRASGGGARGRLDDL